MLNGRVIHLLDAVRAERGRDCRHEVRGSSHHVVLTNADVVFRVAAWGRGCPRTMRRICSRWASPYADANGLVIFYAFHDPNEIWIANEVAEAMIRGGELVMTKPAGEYAQNVYLSTDPWFQRNRARILRARGPFMP